MHVHPGLFEKSRSLCGRQVTQNINQQYDETVTIGGRIADKLSAIAGSWVFIIFFVAVIFSWVFLNSFILATAFGPYPYVFLNLMLSMLAALQAPIIMMSQNRQTNMEYFETNLNF